MRCCSLYLLILVSNWKLEYCCKRNCNRVIYWRHGEERATKKVAPHTAGKPSSQGKKSKGKGTPEKKGSDKTSKQSLVTMEPIDVSELAYTQSTSSSAGPKPSSPAGEEILGLLDAVDDSSKVETPTAATEDLPAKPVSRPSDDKQSTSQAENQTDVEVESSKRAKAEVAAALKKAKAAEKKKVAAERKNGLQKRRRKRSKRQRRKQPWQKMCQQNRCLDPLTRRSPPQGKQLSRTWNYQIGPN